MCGLISTKIEKQQRYPGAICQFEMCNDQRNLHEGLRDSFLHGLEGCALKATVNFLVEGRVVKQRRISNDNK